MKKSVLLLIISLCWTAGSRASAAVSEQWFNRAHASDAAQNPYGLFGFSVALSGDYAVIGAPGAGPGFSREGAAYVYKLDAQGYWNQVAKLTAQPPAGADPLEGDQFGLSVGISGMTVVVGANSSSAYGNDSGLGYIFEEVGGVWTQTARLSPATATANQWLGASAAIDGNVAMLGAAGYGPAGTRAGSVYVFDDSLGNWQERQELKPADGAPYDSFGMSVGLDGPRAIIGAYQDDSPAENAGSAYIFQADGLGVWSQTTKLVAHDADAGDEGGLSVGIDGGFAVIGAHRDDAKGIDAGAAYIFEEASPGVWAEAAKLTASDGSASDFFGYSVAIDGDRALVSAIADNSAGSESGSVYLFTRIAGVWTEVMKITAADGRQGDLFGSDMAMDGGLSIIGARQGGGLGGAAYFSTVPEPSSMLLAIFGVFGGIMSGRRSGDSGRSHRLLKRERLYRGEIAVD